MARKTNYYNKVIDKLQALHKKYPSYNIGRHLSTALSEYGDLWGISDKEVLFALEKYEAELELDFVPDKDIDKIIEEGKNLEALFDNEEDDFE